MKIKTAELLESAAGASQFPDIIIPEIAFAGRSNVGKSTLFNALTSSKKALIYLKDKWKKLHRLIYVIAILGVTHFIWLVKKDLTEPLIYAVIILILLLFRFKFKRV